MKVIDRVVNGRSSITAEMALEPAAALRTSPDFWLDAQKAVDSYELRLAAFAPTALDAAAAAELAWC